MSPIGSTAHAPSDTSREVWALQQRIHAEMGGFGRIQAMAAMFMRVRTMLLLRYDNPVDVLRHLHGEEVSAKDYEAISDLLDRRAVEPTRK